MIAKELHSSNCKDKEVDCGLYMFAMTSWNEFISNTTYVQSFGWIQMSSAIVWVWFISWKTQTFQTSVDILCSRDVQMSPVENAFHVSCIFTSSEMGTDGG